MKHWMIIDNKSGIGNECETLREKENDWNKSEKKLIQQWRCHQYTQFSRHFFFILRFYCCSCSYSMPHILKVVFYNFKLNRPSKPIQNCEIVKEKKNRKVMETSESTIREREHYKRLFKST